jgi:hypothetical protein
MAHHNNNHAHEHAHEHSLIQELICHFPYAVFSVAFALILVSFITKPGLESVGLLQMQSHILFHSFHFMHIVFASAGSMITFLRYSKNLFMGVIISILSPAVFCILSDVVLPYIGGRMLGVDMHWHICFITELHNVLPFLFTGILTGISLSYHGSEQQGFYSVFSHFFHIFVSSIASTLYLVSHGFTTWYDSIGYVFVFLIIAVVIPCTCSDVLVPALIAKAHAKQ